MDSTEAAERLDPRNNPPVGFRYECIVSKYKNTYYDGIGRAIVPDGCVLIRRVLAPDESYDLFVPVKTGDAPSVVAGTKSDDASGSPKLESSSSASLSVTEGEKSVFGKPDALSDSVELPGQMGLLGGITALIHPDYHALNVHCERNDRLLHATLCAYAKWHLDNPDIGSDQLSEILHNAICEAIGDNSFCEWIDKIKEE